MKIPPVLPVYSGARFTITDRIEIAIEMKYFDQNDAKWFHYHRAIEIPASFRSKYYDWFESDRNEISIIFAAAKW